MCQALCRALGNQTRDVAPAPGALSPLASSLPLQATPEFCDSKKASPALLLSMSLRSDQLLLQSQRTHELPRLCRITWAKTSKAWNCPWRLLALTAFGCWGWTHLCSERTLVAPGSPRLHFLWRLSCVSTPPRLLPQPWLSQGPSFRRGIAHLRRPEARNSKVDYVSGCRTLCCFKAQTSEPPGCSHSSAHSSHQVSRAVPGSGDPLSQTFPAGHHPEAPAAAFREQPPPLPLRQAVGPSGGGRVHAEMSSHLAFQTGPGPAFLHPPEARLQMAGTAGQVGDPALAEAGVVRTHLRPVQTGMSSVPPAPPDTSPAQLSEDMCPRTRECSVP